MSLDGPTEDVYEERIARFVELAEAAQQAADAAGKATRPNLQETYATLAEHWLKLACMARNLVDLNPKLARQFDDLSLDQSSSRPH